MLLIKIMMYFHHVKLKTSWLFERSLTHATIKFRWNTTFITLMLSQSSLVFVFMATSKTTVRATYNIKIHTFIRLDTLTGTKQHRVRLFFAFDKLIRNVGY